MLNTLLSVYRDEDDAHALRGIDLIAPLSYACLPERLTLGSLEAMRMAMRMKTRFPEATLAFSNAGHSGFVGCDTREYGFKKKLLHATPHLCVAASFNSIQEAENVRAAIPFSPKRILVICGEAHSRSVRFIWRRVFPEAVIIIRCMPYSHEYQPDHPFPVERYAWPWFFASLARQLLLHIVGLRLRDFHHRAN